MNVKYRYYLCDVFSDRPFGGKPLAVFPNAEGLSDELMRNIAGELNIPKTTFVSPPETGSGTHRLRTFSPSQEVPVGYHASIGTAIVLAWTGDLTPAADGQLKCSFECGAAPMDVLLPLGKHDHAHVQVAAGFFPEPGPLPPPSHAVAEALSLENTDIITTRFSPRVLYCGIPCLFVQLANLDAMRRIRLNNQQWNEIAGRCKAGGIYSFTYETIDADADLHCRFMAPALGVVEEPAAGSAAVGIASILAEGEPRDSISTTWRIEQGVEVGRPSKLVVEVEKRLGAVSQIWIGGTTVYVGQGEIEVKTNAHLSTPQAGTSLQVARGNAIAASQSRQ